jgi:hypothetical protein
VKAAFLNDATCNIENAPDFYRDVAQPVFSPGFVGKAMEWVLPKGTIISDPAEAVLRCQTGQAAPYDEECAAACGMTPAELIRTQRLCLSAMAGIRGKEDQDLYMAGVIDGYAPGTTDEKTVYKPGPLWDKYQAALEAKKAEDE